jgi:ubiquinone/menaquinone biosynthesis C-methylase UbiE
MGIEPHHPLLLIFFQNLKPGTLTTETIGVDVGCGGGRHTEYLASLGIFAIAVDKYLQMLSFTQERLSSTGLHANLIQAEMDDLPIPTEKTDYVISNGVLHNAINVEQIARAMSEISRILRPGGVLLLNLFTNSIISTELTPTDDESTWLTADQIPMVLLAPKLVELLLSEVGLVLTDKPSEKIVDVETGKRNVYKAIFQKSNN